MAKRKTEEQVIAELDAKEKKLAEAKQRMALKEAKFKKARDEIEERQKARALPRALDAADALWALYKKGTLTPETAKICKDYLEGYWENRKIAGLPTAPKPTTAPTGA